MLNIHVINMLYISLRLILRNCPSIATAYCVVLRCYSIFPTLPTLRAKDQGKSPYAFKMFAIKLANLTKIILKTLHFVGLLPPLLNFMQAKKPFIYLVSTLISTSGSIKWVWCSLCLEIGWGRSGPKIGSCLTLSRPITSHCRTAVIRRRWRPMMRLRCKWSVWSAWVVKYRLSFNGIGWVG